VLFVHLAAESALKSIRRSGIKPSAYSPRDVPLGVFALPVVANFYASHQWLRELKRKGVRTIVAVYFRIPDEELVWLGHYREVHERMTAARAGGFLANLAEFEGFEVVIPRKIRPSEVHRTAELPQVLGWRYFPGAHGRKPCGCEFCQRGLFGGRRIRERYRTEAGS
jgi:hypothetical protein